MKGSLFTLNLLETQTILPLIKVIQRWSLPVLVPFGILLLQTIEILGHLLQHFRLELTLGLA